MSVHEPTPAPGRHRQHVERPSGSRRGYGHAVGDDAGFLGESAGVLDVRDVERQLTSRLGPTLTTVAVPERAATRVELQLLDDVAPVEEPHLRAAFRATPTPLLLLSPDLLVRESNAAAEALTGRSAAQLHGIDAFSLFGDGLRLRAEVEQARREGTPVLDRDTTVVRADSGERPVAVSVAAVQDPSGHLVAHLVDRGTLPDRELTLRSDPVTGLLSPGPVVELLREAVIDGHRHRTPTSVLVLRVAGLTRLADELGADIADRAAGELAATLRSAVRGADTVGRVRTETFVVVCRATGVDEANVIADRVCVNTSGAITARGRTIELTTMVRVLAADPGTPPAVAFAALLAEVDPSAQA